MEKILPVVHSEDVVSPILLVHDEASCAVAKNLFGEYTVLVVSELRIAELTALASQSVTIWPENTTGGYKHALSTARAIGGVSTRIVMPKEFPQGWTLADYSSSERPLPDVHAALESAYAPESFGVAAGLQQLEPGQTQRKGQHMANPWPKLSVVALPGLVGECVDLATQHSECDPAAICITLLARFGAEVYGMAPHVGPHVNVGGVVHPPRLFTVICGRTSKARKGTSFHMVKAFFNHKNLLSLGLDSKLLQYPPARETGGPLSTGEGLAAAWDTPSIVKKGQNGYKQYEPPKSLDKRIFVADEEFAAALTSSKRSGNTLSMALRSFWDTGDYAPITKTNPISVTGAHISIVTHTTLNELNHLLDPTMLTNGFCNRFLWICADRSKILAMPRPMPESALLPLCRELWTRIGKAQKCDTLVFTKGANDYWINIYTQLSAEQEGVLGDVTSRSEAQVLRLALLYALIDGQNVIDIDHLKAGLTLWQYAADSAAYIFGSVQMSPLESKILHALQVSSLTRTELHSALGGHVKKDKLDPALATLRRSGSIIFTTEKDDAGQPKNVIKAIV